ncbi:MAG: hypothetical protein PHV68_03645 [Candidatus Gastranaerophilales bacterium]|nr:hypothetical protein [Candidatus Gastranaerophilales bacterium]
MEPNNKNKESSSNEIHEKVEEVSNIEKPKPAVKRAKKFVFTVDADYVDYVDSLTREEKTDLINYLLDLYAKESEEEYKKEKFEKMVKRTATLIITVILAVPIFFIVTSIALDYTHANYLQMQTNFEKLFDNLNKNDDN